MIYKIRKDLTFAVQDQNATRHVLAVGTKMLNKLNETFGTGAEGTVAYANEGARRRPRGIPLITLMASILDPRMKAGIGIPHLDKTFVWRMIREDAINLAVDNLGDAQAQQEPNIPAKEPERREWRQQPNLNQPPYMTRCARGSIAIMRVVSLFCCNLRTYPGNCYRRVRPNCYNHRIVC
jgi:hypothetical protein